MKRLFGISLCLALIVALTVAGVAHTSPPVRTVTQVPDPFVIPAGQGCTFDIQSSPVGGGAVTQFADGRTVTVANANITLTNLAAPQETFLWNSNYHVTETLLDDETVQIVANGRILFWFFPGDQGPFGEVGEDGAFFGLVGTWTTTLDLNTFQFTSFSLQGTLTDICAELMP